MNEFKYQVVNIILLALLGFGIYWAFTTIDNGIIYDKDAVVDTKTEELLEEEEVILFENTKEDPIETIIEEPIKSININTELINELQKIVTNNIILKKGSKGDYVVSVQKFLDIYFNDKNISADGDFGPGTEKFVKEFQKKELNGGDGRVGPNTAKKMIEVLKK